ncbi:M1 family metallopeptidase [Nitrospina sp. 32_T5]|uniref:M1 family metallopeptidase n=1 Tax=unclassified Nitrospina TaxID=2638683 RepID=UPI003F98F19D
MKRLLTFTLILVCLSASVSAFAQSFHRPINHKLSVTLDPDRHHARIEDTLTLYPNSLSGESLTFTLHAAYNIIKVEIPHQGEWKTEVTKVEDAAGDLPPRQHIVIQKPDGKKWPDFLQVLFRYEGRYHDPLRPESDSGREAVPGEEGEKDTGIFLSSESYFYPRLESKSGESLMTFALGVATPRDLKVISQGKRIRETTHNGPRHTLWQCDDPMQEIYIVADRYIEYKDRYEDVTLYAFLRSPDETLAQKYLDAAKGYIRFYDRLLGEYPFVKFALVENSVQTGYGMPSFTLLGSRIIRFPFILHTSFPHEILHNWWGNGVYVDATGGNWSEGLTAYLADHLLQQLDGHGPDYRFQQLIKYLNYVNTQNEIPIAKFMSRHSMASQAIGYGKLLMVLNMLRLEVGDRIFLEALADFYFTQRFHRAGFEHLRAHFELYHGRNLDTFFRQWIEEKGAPELELVHTTVEPFPDAYRLTLEIKQKQARPLFAFQLPVAVWYEGADQPKIELVSIDPQPVQHVTVFVDGEPKAVMLDPYYDVFRKLDRREVPASIGQTYGDGKAVAVMPSVSSRDLIEGFHEFATSVDNLSDMVLDQVYDFSGSAATWVFGRHNLKAQALLPKLAEFGVYPGELGITVNGKLYMYEENSFIFTLPNPQNPGHSVTWVIPHTAAAIPGLIRKLPHYGKYGYLVFSGFAPDNQEKGVWPGDRSALMTTFVTGDYTLPPRPPLTPTRPE